MLAQQCFIKSDADAGSRGYLQDTTRHSLWWIDKISAPGDLVPLVFEDVKVWLQNRLDRDLRWRG